jgi:hypothetical protein
MVNNVLGIFKARDVYLYDTVVNDTLGVSIYINFCSVDHTQLPSKYYILL